jgi:hypothetical protein
MRVGLAPSRSNQPAPAFSLNRGDMLLGNKDLSRQIRGCRDESVMPSERTNSRPREAFFQVPHYDEGQNLQRPWVLLAFKLLSWTAAGDAIDRVLGPTAFLPAKFRTTR